MTLVTISCQCRTKHNIAEQNLQKIYNFYAALLILRMMANSARAEFWHAYVIPCYMDFCTLANIFWTYSRLDRIPHVQRWSRLFKGADFLRAGCFPANCIKELMDWYLCSSEFNFSAQILNNTIPSVKQTLRHFYCANTDSHLITFAILCSAVVTTIKITKTLHDTASASVQY